MEYLRNTFKIIKFNLKTLVKFEIIFKLLLSLIFMPIAITSLNLTMKITGYTYLTLENIFDFALNPLTIFLLLIVIMYVTFVTLFDISTMIVIYDASYHEKKIKLKDAIKISLTKCKRVIKPRNMLVAFMLLFLIPFLNLGIGSNVISSIKIPEFILDYISTNGILTCILYFTYLFLGILLMKWIYSIHYMILEEKDFKEARKNSKNLSKGNKFKDIIRILIAQMIIAISYIIIVLAEILLITYITNNLLSNIKGISSIAITLIWIFTILYLGLFVILSNSLSYAIISSLFYMHKDKNKEEILVGNYNNLSEDKKSNRILRNIGITIFILAIIGGSIFTYQVITGKVNLNIEFVRNMEITAHRGASVNYPENTMSAFKGAKELGADWIELDVQQTKDKKIVVAHDTNLLRITGIDKEIIDLTYDEISKLDVGSFFSEEFKGEKIPLLDEVLEFCKDNNIRLNIELKPTGKEKYFEQQVIELIKKYNFQDRCVITSQNYSVLENIKNIDSDMKTVYVMSVAIGKITDLKYADAFSVEASNVTNNLVSRVHNEGKELFAWTVNTQESINKMINMNVDNIITDNISLGKKLVLESKYGDVFNEFIKMLSD